MGSLCGQSTLRVIGLSGFKTTRCSPKVGLCWLGRTAPAKGDRGEARGPVDTRGGNDHSRPSTGLRGQEGAVLRSSADEWTVRLVEPFPLESVSPKG